METEKMTEEKENQDIDLTDVDSAEENAQDAAAAAEPSMEALLEQQASLHERLEKHEIVWLKVVHVKDDVVQIDIGEKHEGQIPLSEFDAGVKPAVGARIPAVLVSRRRGEDKPAVLSYKKARMQLGWDQVVKAYEDKARVRGIVTSAIKGGFMVDVSGVSAFLPASLADLRPVRKPQSLLKTGVRCYIIEVNKEKKQLVLSRKAVLEEEVKKRRDKFLEKVKVGSIVLGRVTHVGSAGVFVNLGGVEGVVPTSELSWKEPEKAKQAVSHNQKLRMKIVKIEPEAGKITLGVKQLLANPADALKRKFPPKTTLKGKILEVKPEGVRVEISANTTAFCPIEELSRKDNAVKEEKNARFGDEHRGRRDRTEVKITADQVIWPAVGDTVNLIVLGVSYSNFEVTASIRRFEEMEDRKRVAKYLKGAPKFTLGQIFAAEEEDA